mgnify:CR=1 FL=1
MEARKSLAEALTTLDEEAPAMEPGHGGQEERPQMLVKVEAIPSPPQWSLAMEARKSSSFWFAPSVVSSPQWSLAMEARKRRSRVGVEPLPFAPAMEPGHGGQEERVEPELLRAEQRHLPAMEPGHGGQEERSRARQVVCGRSARNGAWPWRPGRDVAGLAVEVAGRAPAMEPGHGGQEEARRGGRGSSAPSGV